VSPSCERWKGRAAVTRGGACRATRMILVGAVEERSKAVVVPLSHGSERDKARKCGEGARVRIIPAVFNKAVCVLEGSSGEKPTSDHLDRPPPLRVGRTVLDLQHLWSRWRDVDVRQ